MHQGTIEQWDSAYDLYHRPRTRFVADFVGQGVFLRGVATRHGQRGDRAWRARHADAADARRKAMPSTCSFAPTTSCTTTTARGRPKSPPRRSAARTSSTRLSSCRERRCCRWSRRITTMRSASASGSGSRSITSSRSRASGAVSAPTRSCVDLRERVVDRVLTARADQACELLAVAHEHQRGPQLDAKRASEPPSAAVLDLDVTDVAGWLASALASSGCAARQCPHHGVPNSTTLGPSKRVDLLARRLDGGVDWCSWPSCRD